MTLEKTKLRAGKYMIPATLEYTDKFIYIRFKFNRILLNEIRAMSGAHWCGFDKPPKKVWRILNNVRNHFNLLFLKGENPFYQYQQPLDDTIEEIRKSIKRPLYDHQIEMVAQILKRHYAIIAGEMGTGKTLAAIEAAERAGIKSSEIMYVGPKSGVMAVRREFRKWECQLHPIWLTYEGLTKAIREGLYKDHVPRFVIYDESSRIKNPNAQRSMAAFDLAERVRNKWMKDGYVVLMSGTPAPRVPTDWWYNAEVACPGYIKEGDIHKFKARMCVIENRESVTGGVYPHIVAWLDDPNKCKDCGKYKNDPVHNEVAAITQGLKYHDFAPSKNEVEYLYQRLKGLVLVKFKKDCLDLPEKRYEIIQIKPTVSMLQMARMITKTSSRTIEALTLLRELSDGFQYKETKTGTKVCELCQGLGRQVSPDVPCDSDIGSIAFPKGIDGDVSSEGQGNTNICDRCGGSGKVPQYERTTEEVSTPKDKVLVDILESHEEVGRLIVWCGFTGTVDRVCNLCHSNGWSTLRVDGRGYRTHDVLGNTIDPQIYLSAMDGSDPNFKQLLEDHPKLCFVGHPKAGGMALTLTASPTTLYYSNDFNGEARMQSEDRFHRAGMDANRGATIIDLIHLPSDRLVLDNLIKKKKLQSLTMGELAEAIS